MQKQPKFAQKWHYFAQKLQKICQNKIKFVVHPVTILLMMLSIFVGMFWLFFVYFASLVYHEFAHAIVAKKLGYKMDKIVLYPTGALLYGATDEFCFKDEILVALAGPVANLVLTIVCVCLWWLVPESYNYLQDVVVANLSLACFNLLPIFPLDGGRVLLAILSCKFERKQACRLAKLVAINFCIFLFLYFVVTLFFVPNFQIGIMSIVLAISATSEDKKLAFKRIAKTGIKRRKLAKGLRKVTLVFDTKATLKSVINRIDNFAIYSVVVMDGNFCEIANFSELQVEELCKDFSLAETLGDVLNCKR